MTICSTPATSCVDVLYPAAAPRGQATAPFGSNGVSTFATAKFCPCASSMSTVPHTSRDTESYTRPTIFVTPTFDLTPVELLEMSNRTALRTFTASPETVPYIDQKRV